MTSFKLKFGTNQKTTNKRLLVVEALIRRLKASSPSCDKTNLLLQVTPPGRVSQEFKLRQLHQWSNFQKHQSTWATQPNPQKTEKPDRFW